MPRPDRGRVPRAAPPYISKSLDEGVLRLVVSGEQPPHGVVRDIVDLVTDYGVREEAGALWLALVDVRPAAFNVPGDEMRAGAGRISAIRTRGRLALLTGNDLQFGLGRMLGLLCDASSVEVQPFRDETAALRWLSGVEPR